MQKSDLRPRLMTKAEAAAYCAVTPSRFYQLVKAGTLPGAIPGTTRYDRAALDRALDKLSGLTTDAELSPLQKWKQARDGSRAA
jgi:excisionase family DNA binding protein